MAHYGMLPDFLQDLRNVGLSAEDLAPLFRGRYDYIVMWEKAEERSDAFARTVRRDFGDTIGRGCPPINAGRTASFLGAAPAPKPRPQKGHAGGVNIAPVQARSRRHELGNAARGWARLHVWAATRP